LFAARVSVPVPDLVSDPLPLMIPERVRTPPRLTVRFLLLAMSPTIDPLPVS
jgi:hypothetical protein